MSSLEGKCLTCVGTGRIGPIWTSIESQDAIDRMTRSEKAALSVLCPMCAESGKSDIYPPPDSEDAA